MNIYTRIHARNIASPPSPESLPEKLIPVIQEVADLHARYQAVSQELAKEQQSRQAVLDEDAKRASELLRTGKEKEASKQPALAEHEARLSELGHKSRTYAQALSDASREAARAVEAFRPDLEREADEYRERSKSAMLAALDQLAAAAEDHGRATAQLDWVEKFPQGTVAKTGPYMLLTELQTADGPVRADRAIEQMRASVVA